MSLLAIGLRPYFVRGLHNVAGKQDRSALADLIIERRAAFQLSLGAPAGALVLDFGGPEHIRHAVAADCSRLSSSCFQTLASISTETEEKNTLPWSFIKLYYASYYAGHTIIRLLGNSCSYLDGRHTAKLQALAVLLGSPAQLKIETGVYNFSIDAAGSVIKGSKMMNANSHEAFWTMLSDVWRDIAKKVLSGPLIEIEAQAVFGKLDEFDRLMRSMGSYSWLSTIRNDIQYKHRHEVWFPSSFSKRDRAAFGRLAGQWTSDPMAIELQAVRFGLLGQFVSACVFLISLCRVLLIHLDQLCASGVRSFTRFGPLAFLSAAQIRLSA